MNQEELNKQFLAAAKKDDLIKVKSLIQQGADLEAKDNNDNNALMWASRKGYLEVIKYLIEHGADLEAKDNNDNNALMYASYNGYLEVVKYLIQHGANIEAKDDYNRTALMLASSIGFLEVVKYLKSDAYIDSTLGSKYDYKLSRKQQIIDAVKKDPSIIDKLNKDELKDISELQHLLKLDDYGLFEHIKSFQQWNKLR